MLDRYTIAVIKAPLNLIGKRVHQQRISANQVTIVGFFLGLCSVPLLWLQHYHLALVFILLNRLFDGIDGAVARQTGISDSGGFLDISLDFVFYSSIPFGFVLANPIDNGLAGAMLIFAFIGTGTSFLSFAVMASRYQIANPIYQNKSLYYMSGLTEGTETILCFVLMCLLPDHFTLIATVFAAMCAFTTVTRIWYGFHTIKKCETAASQDATLQ
jgi:phosphatidylglycerophosphate synthase